MESGGIVIGSWARDGKTTLIVGLAKNLEKRIGYFKPLRQKIINIGNITTDEDAHFISHLLQLKEEELLSPLAYPSSGINKEEIKNIFQNIAKDKEYILVESSLSLGFTVNLSAFHLAALLELPLLVVVEEDENYMEEITIANTLAKTLGVEKISFILNKVKKDIGLHPKLEANIIGVLPFCKELSALRVRDVVREFNALVLAGKNNLDNLIEKVLIGAMTPEHASHYFQIYGAKAVITGGDRTDLIDATLSTSTACVILTGDICPEVSVIKKAEERNIPLLMVSWDTMTATERLDALITRWRIEDEEKVNFASKLIKENIDLGRIGGE